MTDLIPSPTRDAARSYLAAGWSPIPLPAGQKWPPPNGVTGWRGRYTTTQDLTRTGWDWNGNIGLRLPPDVIGIDVDVYNGGTLEEFEQRLGPLPPTIWSTSRDDGSGIALYRVPVGTVLATDPATGIDIIQAHHRYIVCAPSINPKTLLPYRWIDEQSEEPADGPPHPGELPDLPWPWIEALAVDKQAGANAVTPDAAVAFVETHTARNNPNALNGISSHLTTIRPGGRHDGLVTTMCWAMREAAAGYYTADEAITAIHAWWITAVEPPRRDNGEFGAAVLWAIGQAETDTARINQLERAVNLNALIAPTTINGGPPDDPADHDWATVHLTDIATAMRTGEYQQITPTVLQVEGASPLLYPGRTNSLFGESGGGKTWIGLAALTEVVRNGGCCLFLDWEDTPAGTTERLINIGLTDEEIERVDYRNPTTGLGVGIDYLEHHLEAGDYALVVLDSTGEAMASGAVNPNADEEVAMWFRRVKELTKLPGGPAVVVLDHVPKDKDAPAAYAIGSQRKRAAVTGASYRVDTLKEPAKGRDGKYRLTVAKDRPGNRAKGTTAAEVDVISGTEGAITLRFHISDAQAAHNAGEKWRPTIYMERVSQWLEFNPGASLRAITEGCQGKKEVIYTAVEILIEEAWVVVADGPRNARLHTNARSYRESIDPKLLVDNSTLAPSPNRPPTVPQGTVSHPGTVPHPLTKGDGDGGTLAQLSTDDRPLAHPAIEYEDPFA